MKVTITGFEHENLARIKTISSMDKRFSFFTKRLKVRTKIAVATPTDMYKITTFSVVLIIISALKAAPPNVKQDFCACKKM
ncbi:hypothetical protein [Enterobacter hormaechei]|uniref:hypothetical protein n=1 Tax=Enterobacter hormaechei TaxID=158836 RepID=UPI000AD58F3F|nr:hypothetical protein [Enterobacter hormaechei]